MKKPIILISDRNHNVRELLKRELEAEGYQVLVAKNGKELLMHAFKPDPIDILILDPDLPDAEQISLLGKIRYWVPAFPIIIHALSDESCHKKGVLIGHAFIEKDGSSIEYLKQAITKLLGNSSGKK